MDQHIRYSIKPHKGYHIDKFFLNTLTSKLKSYNKDMSFSFRFFDGISTYDFNSLEEFYSNEVKISNKIQKIEIFAYFITDDPYSSNQISFSFGNQLDFFACFSTEIIFEVTFEEDFYALRDIVELLLKNHTLSYSFFSRLPLVLIISVSFFIFICAFTYIRNIVFSPTTVYLIFAACIFVPIVSFFKKPRKIKRFLFPLNEFEFANNIIENQKASKTRSTIVGSIIIAIIIDFSVNCFFNLF